MCSRLTTIGDVIGDLNRRRGMIKSQEAGVTGVRVKAGAHWQKSLATSVTCAP